MALAFRTGLPSTKKLVLLALCDSANDQGECYPSIDALEQKCSLSDRAVQKAVVELEVAGYLSRQLRPGRATLYLMTPERGSPPNVVHPERRSPTPERRSPPPPNDVHHTPERRSPRTIKEPPIEPSQKRDGGAAQATAPAPFLGDVNLETFDAKTRSALGPGWELPAQWGFDAEALGWKPAEIIKEAEKFRQYFVSGKGKGTRRSIKGWRQSWSNWLSNAERYSR